uniref:Ubiquitin-related modifier 1 homolog n=1 Tax=Chromera velia CCMP2878 TaxID=1169474 RepID=A0A0G4I5S6_9ALVE|mmetsp:Transcript_10016/g.19394  ORF Transcript_10016/g.19394 Transcript_10016/m.19394 type:complete len:98 (+) Transcript_10016:160-453(+)|eukprot:Cvel_11183.t1-p1 / transcript=Cvel_11183.t1 / gene=Cvel_11183 / organism=Chromera_velia_CCMP2878 / gene_product=Ubiquitin-related modifier 1 homolog, putative / transcript_product=Ubiquitin-related modifier 1 homolog, putative / location=Cvel_scaffold694:31480-33012(-) / protein_length=97 / sequence_SO=supercontig / SO=protein_coding / is_pseudo=false
MKLSVEFSGGLELLVDKQKKHEVVLESTKQKVTVADLIVHIRDQMLKERHDLFALGDNLRPGILVLINDTDWEIESGPATELSDGDSVSFISTLHGG